MPTQRKSRALATSAGARSLTLFAGSLPLHGSADGQGGAARFFCPSGVAVDKTGNAYVTDTGNHTIRKLTPAGVVTTLAGTAGAAGSADGTGAAARFNCPAGIAVDALGNLLVVDTKNNTLRLISPSGAVTTLAGTAGANDSADGPREVARFNGPWDLALDGAGNIFVSEPGSNTIRMVTAAGFVSTLAGLAGMSGSADGMGSAARFNGPCGLAVDGLGNVLVVDNGNSTLRKITPAGAVTTLAGQASNCGSDDGAGGSARFANPMAVAVDGAGNLYLTDTNSATVRKITPTGVVTTLAGAAGLTGCADGAPAAARFYAPYGIAVDAQGNLLVVDNSNGNLRQITPAGRVSTLAGKAGGIGSADGAGAAATFNYPTGLAQDASGNLYVTDTDNFILRKVTPGGRVSSLAGSPGVRGSGDGLGAAATFSHLYGVAVDGAGTLFVADASNNTIRRITRSGLVSTLAGLAGAAGSADGIGAQARFQDPFGVALDGAGNLYVSDAGNNTIRKITAAGLVSTLAGSPGSTGCADGAGAAASFNCPLGLALDSKGNLQVADSGNNTLRTITPEGMVSTLAGTAGTAGSADGAGAAARFNYPYYLAVDGSGNVVVSDNGNALIRMVTPSGLVTTLVGGNGQGKTVLGPLPASLANPGGVAVDPQTGQMFIAVCNAILVVK